MSPEKEFINLKLNYQGFDNEQISMYHDKSNMNRKTPEGSINEKSVHDNENMSIKEIILKSMEKNEKITI